MLKSTFCAYVVLSTLIAAGSAQVRYEECEFVGGASICVDPASVVLETPHHEPLAGGRLVGLTVQPDTTTFSVQNDPFTVRAFYTDVADFIDTHPGSVQLDPSGTFYEVDVGLVPAAEAASPRLRDSLIPGDGTILWVVSTSIRNFLENPPEDTNAFAGIFHAGCSLDDERRDADGNPPCGRRFPFSGFLVLYDVHPDWPTAIARDPEVRSEFSEVVRACR
jgi:hypothetical protein